MGIKSMTGFGRGENSGFGSTYTFEMKSVNHRFLEISVRYPRTLSVFEDRIRKYIQERVQRGRIDVHLNVKETEEKKKLVKVDKELALSYDKSLKELAIALNTGYESNIFQLVNLPEVLTVEEDEIDEEELWKVLEVALAGALDDFLKMREAEGHKLAEDLIRRLHTIRRLKEEIAQLEGQVVQDYQVRLRERIQQLLGADVVIDEARLANEVAYFADRASITEELVRLDSHLHQCEKLLSSNEPVGRKMDFIVQEMNREINTIGSKANNIEIAQAVIEAKSELEKIREQVQNIE